MQFWEFFLYLHSYILLFKREGLEEVFAVLSLFSHVWLFVTPWTLACQAAEIPGVGCHALLQKRCLISVNFTVHWELKTQHKLSCFNPDEISVNLENWIGFKIQNNSRWQNGWRDSLVQPVSFLSYINFSVLRVLLQL